MNGHGTRKRALLAGILLVTAVPVLAGVTGRAPRTHDMVAERILARYDAYTFPESLCATEAIPKAPYDLALIYSDGRILLQMTDRETRRGVRIPAQATVEVMGDSEETRPSSWVSVRSSCESGSLLFDHGNLTASFPIASVSKSAATIWTR